MTNRCVIFYTIYLSKYIKFNLLYDYASLNTKL